MESPEVHMSAERQHICEPLIDEHEYHHQLSAVPDKTAGPEFDQKPPPW